MSGLPESESRYPVLVLTKYYDIKQTEPPTTNDCESAVPFRKCKTASCPCYYRLSQYWESKLPEPLLGYHARKINPLIFWNPTAVALSPITLQFWGLFAERSLNTLK
uniref:Uncharacterized protein n=1 Tax=Glossina pallidipes TaxID=7398 RepID=A0A1B0AEC5_GLOPL